MERSLLMFIHVLRAQGVRVSTAEAVDALRCAAVPGMLDNPVRLHAALRAVIVTRPGDLGTFDAVFALFFSLQPFAERTSGDDGDQPSADLGDGDGAGADDGEEAETATLSGSGVEPHVQTPQSVPNLRDAFDPEAMRDGVGMDDDDTSLVNLGATSGELAFSAQPSGGDAGVRVQLDVTHGAGVDQPGALAPATGQGIEFDLTEDEQRALLRWLGAPDAVDAPGDDGVTALLDRLPPSLAEQLRTLIELRTAGATDDATPAVIDEVAEREREAFEASLRRLARSLQGGLAQRRRSSPDGRVHPALTTRRSLRYDGIPFRPVTVERARERSRVIVLADVSLSVRPAARFTLRMVHSMHRILGQTRTFAFVDDLVEVTDLFDSHPIEHALGLVFGGDVLDTEGTSDYGAVFEQLLHGDVHLDRRTSLIVVGDGRSNGRDPGLGALQELARRLRRVVWLTPEPRYSWGLGSCSLPEYAPFCERIEVVRDLRGLERTTERMAVA